MKLKTFIDQFLAFTQKEFFHSSRQKDLASVGCVADLPIVDIRFCFE